LLEALPKVKDKFCKDPQRKNACASSRTLSVILNFELFNMGGICCGSVCTITVLSSQIRSGGYFSIRNLLQISLYSLPVASNFGVEIELVDSESRME